MRNLLNKKKSIQLCKKVQGDSIFQDKSYSDQKSSTKQILFYLFSSKKISFGLHQYSFIVFCSAFQSRRKKLYHLLNLTNHISIQSSIWTHLSAYSII
ncbi:hypothetical protein TTHERM_000809199 (macronuclear) [Tetrahymena thermophila SB210]|uniref:Uncharacterized protein n=1 Tax=Tetrahymena thermophila (strain SB210) TaxID=312017 RepID=W7XD83_TETTS|nr:hypothetical protein TTHERM_000809199 [Tetrahymena thermophila SB210]EWS75462.1 hypothetical protein TTHERM_000809199 [Tetrahymena thermophila SB210]|eukprot:XP_012652009.1 hypothetical protein TTHERM_000809199 [Tetrahymena thermophila SB210]